MRTILKTTSPEVALTRILETLEQELIDASDEEIMEAARDLGMNPEMKGSAAFAGVKYPAKPQLSDFFEFEACRNAQIEAERIANTTQTQRERNTPQPRQIEMPKERTDSGDK